MPTTRPLEYQFLPVDERLEISESIRAERVKEFAQEILGDLRLLDDAVAAFSDRFSATGLFMCLSDVARCRGDQMGIYGSTLQRHLQTIANWYAEQQTPAVPMFLKPQAGDF